MAFKVKISGINIVLNGIDQYSKDVQKQVEDEIKDWAKRTEAAAIRDVPVDTGQLRSTIRSVVGANGITWIVKAGGIKDVDYAPYVEFGTGALVDQSFLQQYGLVSYAQQFKGKGERLVNLPARTFLYRNAADELAKSVAEIKKIIEKSWK